MKKDEKIERMFAGGGGKNCHGFICIFKKIYSYLYFSKYLLNLL